MDAYERLGVTRSDSIDEIESAYHRLLRAYHPDLHQDGTPEEIAAAERITVELNDAMTRIRSTHVEGQSSWTRPTREDRRPTSDEDFAWPYATPPDTDWFGNPLGPRRNRAEYVDCPLCGFRFTDSVVYRSHLAHDHHHGEVFPDGPPADDDRSRRLSLHWLAWVPAPAFWFFVVVIVYWSIVYALLGEGPLTFVAIWLGVVWYGFTLRLAYKHRRGSA